MASDTGSVIVESSDNGISFLRNENGVSVFLKKRPKKLKKKKVQKVPFKCQHCNEEFPNYDAHAKHVEKVHPVPHACPTPNCYYRTARKWYMRAHIRRVHGPNAINCPIDGCEGFFVKNALQKHVKTAHRNKEAGSQKSAKLQKTLHKCDYCEYQTESPKLFEHHTKDFHLNGCICPVENCEEKIFADKINDHFTSKHYGIEFVYSLGKDLKLKDVIVGDKTADVDAAEIGQEDIIRDEDTNEVAIDIEQQEKENSDMDYEFETEKTAVGFNGFSCLKCSKTFLLRRSLIRHIASVHEKRYKKYERAKKFLCTFENCNKSFKCQTLLNDHLNMHNGNYEYKCDNCSQQFFARAQFAVHLTKYHNKSIKDIAKDPIISNFRAVMVSG